MKPPAKSSGPATCVSGFTVIECVVVLGIVSLLALMVLPAVHSAREASRRVGCSNHLRQIGLALGGYEAGQGYFPSICGRTAWPSSKSISIHYFSPITRMLTHFDQTNLYNAINFTYPPATSRALLANATAMKTTLGVLLCPSNPSAPVPGYGRTDYRFNYGKSPWAIYTPAVGLDPDAASGPFSVGVFYRASDFADGLSTTIAVSERVQGDWLKGVFRLAGDYRLANIPGSPAPTTGSAIAACRALPADTPHESRGGESWFLSGFHFSGYNHATTPNSPFQDCAFDTNVGGLHSRFMRDGVFAARGTHPGGVLALSLDGRVRFIGDGIDQAIWEALATRASGDFSED